MSFTDEQIENLKKAINSAETVTNYLEVGTPNLNALLARLEAGEAYAEQASQHTHHCSSAFGDTCKVCKTFKAWKKSKGEGDR